MAGPLVINDPGSPLFANRKRIITTPGVHDDDLVSKAYAFQQATDSIRLVLHYDSYAYLRSIHRDKRACDSYGLFLK